MNTSIESYRAQIGIWHSTCYARSTKPKKVLLTPIKIKVLLGLILSSYGIFIGALLLLRCGDIEEHPGPTFDLKTLSISHINIQSLYPHDPQEITGHTRRKINEIETTLINDLGIDIVCLSETWLKPEITDNDIDITGFKIHRKDRIDTRAGGVGIYINNHLLN